MTTIWHNPRCSKSRQTLALLQEAGHSPQIIRYLETPPTDQEIRAALVALGIEAAALLRTGEKTFRTTGISKTDAPDKLIAAMAANPILIERPIVFHNGKAAIGRPPEAVLSLFASPSS